jgi:hypothetical protein
MMKKISIIVLLLSTLFLAGCGKTGQDMSFQDAYKKIVSYTAKNITTTTSSDETKAVHDETVVDFSLHANAWFAASGTLKSIGDYTINQSWSAVIMWLSIDSQAYEPSFWSDVKITWDIQFVENSWVTYGKINWFSLTPEKETGNVEWWVINALIKTISNKRITLSEWAEKISLIPYRKNITELMRQLNIWWSQNILFKEVWKTTIDWYTAYKIWWNKDGVKSFIQYILKDAKNIWVPIIFDWATIDEAIQGIMNSPIEWYMIIKSSNDIILRIDSITTQDSWILWVTYSKDWVEAVLKNNDNTIIATWDIRPKNTELFFNLAIPSNNVYIWWQTEKNQEVVRLQFKNSEFVLNAIIWGTSKTIDLFSPIVVTWSTPLSQIIQWFNLLQWNEQSSNSEWVSDIK